MHFTADWCVPCKQMKPVIEQFRFANKDIIYHNINIDLPENKELVKDFGVMGVPTFIALIDNNIHDRHTGLASKFKLESLFG